MDLGSLFFKLGFDVVGKNKAEEFSQTTFGLNENTIQLNSSLEQMAFILEKIALKMQAVSQIDLDNFKAVQSLDTGTVLDLGVETKLPAKRDDKKVSSLKKFALETVKQVKILQTELERVGESKLPYYIQKQNDTFLSGVPKIAAYTAGIIGLATATAAAITKGAEWATQLTRFNTTTGLSSERLQALHAATAASGMSVDHLASTMDNLKNVAFDISMGRADATPWHLLGVNPSSDPLATLAQLQASMERIGKTKFSIYARDAGISPEIMTLLAEMKEGTPADKRLLLSKEEMKDLHLYNMSVNTGMANLKNLGVKIMAIISPLGSAIMNVFDRAMKITGSVMDLFTKFTGSIGFTTEKVLTLGLAFAGLWAAAFAPAVLGIGILLLALDDVIAFFDGDDSITGTIIKSMEPLLNWFKVVGDSIKLYVIEPLKPFFEFINEQMGNLFNLLTQFTKIVGGGFGFANSINSIFGGEPESPTGSKTSASSSVSNTQNSVSITVNGSKEPSAVADEIDRKMRQTLSNAFIGSPIGRK